jgi:hypothetical protein
MVDNVNILYVNKQEKWFKYKNIGLGFKLINSTSFGESLFFAGLFQKM